MKKTIIASSLAVALGVTGYAATSGHQAHAAETNVDQAHLVDLAHNHPEQLNAAPIQDGAYDIHFVQGGFQYNFTSDGHTWAWSYDVANGQTTSFATTAAQGTTDYSASYNQEATTTQAVSNNAQSSNANVETVSAPSANYTTSTASSSSVRLSNGNTAGAIGSYAARIMAQRTGVPASTWEAIIARESNGQVNAHNPSGASGLFQTMPGWGPTNTVDQQIDAADKAFKAQGLSAWGK
ncbi:transglycosylase SLT domain-containing protein [Staphylococcus simiae]|uniref:Probable transglycosylase IsaA n=1 Tax=Staphylococcus simiae CCM 7213 = CCUG 51256 TaxID=911238 RepID=G5JI80_9STAP|nr:transglycosylase SLT domain-containing protein [Staphylococcus simiae]EHJ08097.1 immunodominant antigen A [Staphylococcus simiae CCM 7213 = CCUG 51256]PNZ11981.1 transglycosylase [Staphylococcus simiae]SNV82717.1 Immunodominant staphylococcal antigen A precursor [Staphylococcus simiae]